MIVDSSAIIAYAFAEPTADALERILQDSAESWISSASVVESGMVIEAQLGVDGHANVMRILQAMDIRIAPLDAPQAALALEGFRRFGKGRHAASLNFGDCLVYGLSRTLKQPILCLGGDFAQTDVATVPIM